MLWARLEDLALALCHSFLDLDDITGLRSTRIQSKLRRSPLSQLLTIPFRPVHHEHSILLLRSHIFHIEDRRSSLQHPRGRNDYTWSFRGSSPIIPAVNPVRHLTRTLENLGITQSRRILQEQFHCVQSHSIDENRMLEMVCGEDAEQFL